MRDGAARKIFGGLAGATQASTAPPLPSRPGLGERCLSCRSDPKIPLARVPEAVERLGGRALCADCAAVARGGRALGRERPAAEQRREPGQSVSTSQRMTPPHERSDDDGDLRSHQG